MSLGKIVYKNCVDEELLPLIADGDSLAFEEIYSRYGQRLFSYFFRMLWKNKELAEDFTQDLFLKLVKHAARFNIEKSFTTWLYSIAYNMCKNEYRKHEIRTIHVEAQKKNQFASTNEVNIDLQRFKEAVHKYVGELNEEKRTLYILRFQENLTVPNISEILHVPEGTIKSRIFYLLKEMKGKLKEFETVHIQI